MPKIHEPGHRARERMIAKQIASRGIRDDRVLEAMRTVPREHFVAPEAVEFAYEDVALPIEAGQTISQPYVVAVMLQALAVQPTDHALEVGAGSGYAAAVLSRLAARVFAIERHESLARSAERALQRHGYDNVEVLHADGMLGWPARAPFDVILVSAGSAEVPAALLEQLAPGGRMVMPVGEPDLQELHLFRREWGGTLSKRLLGPVRFVPLIGTGVDPIEPTAEEASDGTPEARRRALRRRKAPDAVDVVRSRAEPFEAAEEAAGTAAVKRMAGHRAILIGEASHGTHEFYQLRERLTRRLIERGEVDFVAAEADWPDAIHLDCYVRFGVGTQPDEPPPFGRFPRWMWANEETLSFLRWLRDFNSSIAAPEDRVGFFGLDLYSLHASMDAVLGYLEEVDPDTAVLARERFGCLTPWETNPATYGRLVASGRMKACEDEVVAILTDLLAKRALYQREDGMRYFVAVENARLVANAERYYRAMYRSPSESWNLRDQHMFDTLLDLLGYHGREARAVVWAHNSHVGDASATDMAAGGKHNLGQLCRERFGAGCYAVGFGTHTGTVMAAHDWGGRGMIMDVRPSVPQSYERLCHDAEMPAFLLPLREGEELRRALSAERLQRAIGVIYRPETERTSHYFHAALPRQFDEWVFFDRTRALTPLEPSIDEANEGSMETYPFAV